ncbi:MAG TPA: TlpA disulfide reductase family protein [Pseudosphingobacterium sp.]|nr:TlpA disulfide reductase family protein [Pseudosphingobacterium sp.]
MKNLLLIFIALFTNVLAIHARTKSGADSLYLAGIFEKADFAQPGDRIECRIVQNNALHNWAAYIDLYHTNVVDNAFHVQLPAKDENFYITLSLLKADGKRIPFNAGNAGSIPFLVSRGDSLHLSISEGSTIRFSGKGASKMNCQQEIYLLQVLSKSRASELNGLGNKVRFDEYYGLLKEAIEENLRAKLSILAEYRAQLDPAVFEIMRSDIVGFQYAKLYRALFMARKFDHPEARQRAIEKLCLAPDPLEEALGRRRALSPHLVAAYFEKEQWLLTKDYSMLEEKRDFSFGTYFRAIKEGYSGELRDRLLLTGFLGLVYARDVYQYQDSSLLLMKDNASKLMLEKWGKRNAPRQQAYAFKLPGLDGSYVSLSDLKGKVLVLDFWFTGCFGCRAMPAAMKPFIERFKDEKVLFLSVNTDRKKDTWLASSAEELYTVPGQLELSTYEQGGVIHDFVRYYGIRTFPHIMVIDRNGKIVSSKAPDPRFDKGQALTKMIEELL